MYVHTVRTDDTLAGIASLHGTTEETLRRLNGLRGSSLTSGINLLVPGKPSTLVRHRVGPRETQWTIAKQHGLSVETLAAANGLTAKDWLNAGQLLFVPRVLSSRRAAQANGYLIPSGSAPDADTVRTSRPLTFLTVFSYHITAQGRLASLPDRDALRQAAAEKVEPLLSVTNFDGTNFNPDLAHSILSNPSLRDKVTGEIETVLRAQRFRGVNIDFEHMDPRDRPLYNEFIQQIHARLHPQGYYVTIALGPKTTDEPEAAWMGAFDYKSLGSTVDFLMLMTYEWGWVGGPPMAVAPLDQVEAVLRYATSQIPSDKILMGVPTYGYDWTLPHTPHHLASGVAPLHAQNLAISDGIHVGFDPRAASPHFRYSAKGQEHEVWYEDAKSLLAKFQLVYDFNLRGLSFWVLGQAFPQLWEAVADTFTVRPG